MSLNVALNVAVSGLFANQKAIAATSENIANVNTPEFVRREANFVTDAIPGQFAGVDVDIARAAVDRFLQGASRQGAADAARTDVLAQSLSRIEASLGAPGDNISFANKLNEAFAALTALSANPSSIAAKADALAALDAAFDAFARTQDVIAGEADAAATTAALDAERANALLEEVFRLNQIVPDSPGAADLLDARLAELSSLISINVAQADDGRVEVTTDGGAFLANAGGYSALEVTPGPPAGLSLFAVAPDGGARTLITDDLANAISAGKIRGLVDLQNEALPELEALVAGAARAVADDLNAVYASNVAVGAAAPSGAALIVESAGRFSVNASIADDPASFAIARPTGGATGGANDGAGAAALADLATGAAAGDAGEAVALVGSAARNAELAASTNAAISAELTARAGAAGGVNLDEELSNLILFQRAYNANARVIAAVDELWQSLLSII